MIEVDDRGIRQAEEVRKAIEHREHDQDLNRAIRDFDVALERGNAEALQDAAAALLTADTVAERRYREEIGEAFVRRVAGDGSGEA